MGGLMETVGQGGCASESMGCRCVGHGRIVLLPCIWGSVSFVPLAKRRYTRFLILVLCVAGGLSGLAFGTGSAIAHRAVDSIMGPRTVVHEHQGVEAAPGAAPAAAPASQAADTCAALQHQFVKVKLTAGVCSWFGRLVMMKF